MPRASMPVCTTPISVMSLPGRSAFEHQKVEYFLMEKHAFPLARACKRSVRAPRIKERLLIKINPDHSYISIKFSAERYPLGYLRLVVDIPSGIR